MIFVEGSNELQKVEYLSLAYSICLLFDCCFTYSYIVMPPFQCSTPTIDDQLQMMRLKEV